MDTKGTLKKMYPLFNASEFKNETKERASFTVLNLNDGLFVFSNRDGYMRMNHYFTNDSPTFNYPDVRPTENSSTTTPQIIPHTFRDVDGYGLAYYLVNYGDKYWVTKMTW